MKRQSGIKKRFLIGAIAVALVVAVFTQLSLRTQGLIVEFCTLGDWPLESAMRWHFEKKQPELKSIIDFASDVPEVGGLTVTPMGLRANLRENKAEKHELDKPDILQALISVEAQFVNIDEDQVSVFLGSEERGSTSFEVSYVYPFKSFDMADCEATIAKDRAKIGGCGFKLNASWYAVYKWYPEDIDELKKAMDDLK